MLTFECTYHRDGVIRHKFTVPVVSQVYAGVYCGGVPYLPCMESVKAAMPKTLHKSLERALGFWTDKHSDVVSLELHGYSASKYKYGKPLGTLFARATWKESACRLEGYTHGRLHGTAIRLSESRFQVASDCGTVSIQVSAALAESRLTEAAQSRAIPTFYYE